MTQSAHPPRRRRLASIRGLGRLLLTLALAAPLAVAGIAPALPAAAATASPQPDAPMRMTVDASHPMLITQVVMGHNIGFDTDFTRDDNQRGWNIQQAWAGVPDELKPSMVFVLHPGHNSFLTTDAARGWVEDNLKEGVDLGIHMMVLMGETPTAPADSLNWIESLYQNYPNFIGTDVSELTNQTGAIPGLLKLANEYGGYHVQGSMEEANILGSKLETQSYWDSIKPYAQNFIYTPKNIHDNFDSANAQAMGDWLSGVVGNWGPYFDGYAFYGCGIYGTAAANTSLSLGDRCSRSEPEAVLAMAMLDQWQQGARVFQVENQLDMPGMDSLYGPSFYQSVLPAMRYMLSHAGPSQQAVMSNVKVAFSEKNGNINSLTDVRNGRDVEPTLFDVSEKTPNALQSQDLWYYTRANGRYYQIPRIPKLADQSVLDALTSAGATVIDAPYYNANLTTGDAHYAFFNAKYPQISSGDAFVQNIGNSWLIYNSDYADNFQQDAFVPLKNSDFSELDLTKMGAASYAAVTQSTHALDIQLNNYQDDRTKDLLKDGNNSKRSMEWIDDYMKYSYVPNPQDTALRTDTLQVSSPTPPMLTISGYDKHYTYSQDWNAATHVYTLTVQHNGVVNIHLGTQRTDNGWTTVDGASASISYDNQWNSPSPQHQGTGASFTADGTSFRWTAPAGKGGSADVTIDGVPYATGLAVPAAGGVVFEATGLSNEAHTITISNRRGDVRIASLAYVPSTEQMLNDVSLADFTYASEAEDQGTVWGDTHWTVSNGAMKILPYVSPWFGDETIYNTVGKYQDVTYEAKLQSGKGTPVNLMVRADPIAKTSYMLRLDPTNSGGNGEVTLVRDDSTVLAADTGAALNTGTWYDVKIQATGNRIQGWIDGTQVIDYTDTSSSARLTAGYTGVRVESKNVGGAGDFEYVDDVSVQSGGSTVYTSDFSSWDAARTWITEGPLVFGAADNRTSLNFPWEWKATSGSWKVVKSDVRTNGLSGIYSGAATSNAESVTLAGSSDWSNEIYSSMVRLTGGDQVGLVLRAADTDNQYRVIADAETNTLKLVDVTNGKKKTLASTGFTVPRDTWFNIKVTAEGGLIVANVNGKDMLTVNDDGHPKGQVGYYLFKTGTADFDDARIVDLPASSAAPGPVALSVTGADQAMGPTHITGVVPVTVKTAKDSAPALPAMVSAISSDGSRDEVPVTWASIDPASYATATTPYADGPTRGTFTVAGSIPGSSVEAVATVTVMPKLAAPLTSKYTYDPANPGLPPITFTNVAYDAGGGVTYKRQVYVRWDQAIAVTADSPTQTLTGTIEGDPWEKATASIALKPQAPASLAQGKPTVSFWSLAKNPATLAVDGNTATEWKTGGASDGSFSDGTSTSANGSLCDWFYVDLGSEQTISSFAIQWGENVTTYGKMYDAPYQIQIVDGGVAPTDARLNNSVCSRLGGSTYPTTSASQDIWTTVASGTGTLTLDRHALATPVTARYVRVFTNEPLTAHRYGTSVYEFQVFAN